MYRALQYYITDGRKEDGGSAHIQNVSIQNVSVAERLGNTTSPVKQRLQNKMSP
jgi:hypothetical protein